MRSSPSIRFRNTTVVRQLRDYATRVSFINSLHEREKIPTDSALTRLQELWDELEIGEADTGPHTECEG